MAEPQRRRSFPGIDPAFQEAVIQQVFETAYYFEVVVTDIDFKPDPRHGRWMVDVGVCCEHGSRACTFSLTPTAQGLSDAVPIIRQLIGDWTR